MLSVFQFRDVQNGYEIETKAHGEGAGKEKMEGPPPAKVDRC